MYIHVIS